MLDKPWNAAIKPEGAKTTSLAHLVRLAGASERLTACAELPGGLNVITLWDLAIRPHATLIKISETHGMNMATTDEAVSLAFEATGTADAPAPVKALARWADTTGWTKMSIRDVLEAMPCTQAVVSGAKKGALEKVKALDVIQGLPESVSLVMRAGVKRSMPQDVVTKILELAGDRPTRGDGLAQNPEVARLLGTLDARRRHVIMERTGFNGRKVSIKDLAHVYGVSSQMISNVEFSAARLLRAADVDGVFKDILKDPAHLFARLADGSAAIKNVSKSEMGRIISAVETLAMRVVHGGTTQWLDDVAVRFGEGWLPPGSNAMAASRALAAIGGKLEPEKLPRPILPLAPIAGVDAGELHAIIESQPGLRVEGGYAFDGFGARKVRSARCHAIVEARGWRTFDLQDVADAYWEEYAEDERTRLINIRIALSEEKRLFLLLNNNIWMNLHALGRAGRPQQMVRQPKATGMRERDDEIAATLARFGCGPSLPPMKIGGDVCEKDVALNQELRVMTRYEPTLRLVAPGMIARQGEVDQAWMMRNWRRINASTHSGWGYAMAMRSGAPRNLYALWGPAYERAYCERALAKGNDALVDSLLTVSDVGSWPGDPEEIAPWLERAATAKWSISWETPSERITIVTGKEMLRAMAWTWAFGRIGTPMCSKIMGRRLSEPHGRMIVRCLVACGALEEPGDPSLASKPGPRFRAIMTAMRDSMIESGTADWGQPGFRDIAESAPKDVDFTNPPDRPEGASFPFVGKRSTYTP